MRNLQFFGNVNNQICNCQNINVDFARRYFQERIPRIKVTNPEGTYLLWLDCRELGLDHVALKEWMLKKAKVAIVPGSEFGKNGEGFIRCSFATDYRLIEKALERMEKFLAKHK